MNLLGQRKGSENMIELLLCALAALAFVGVCGLIYWVWDKISPIREDRPLNRGNLKEPRLKEREDYWAA